MPFTDEGKIIYEPKVNGHFMWDYNLDMCDEGCSCKYDSEEDGDELPILHMRFQKSKDLKVHQLSSSTYWCSAEADCCSCNSPTPTCL